jgi:hypothetical protein
MLTSALFALALICGMAATAAAEDTKVLALGIADHEATTAELETGAAVPAPHFDTAAIAYGLVVGLKKGDTIEIALVNEDRSLLHNTQTLAEDQARFLLEAGKRGVPAGGWPEGSYHAKVTITRDGKTLVEQSSKPIVFE